MMACNNGSEKILCCIKYHSKILTYNSITNKIESTSIEKPVSCITICPEDCHSDISFAEDSFYTYTIVPSADECSGDAICDKNYALYFDTNTCLHEEKFVNNKEEAESYIIGSNKLIVFVPCLSEFMSVSSPGEFNKLIATEKNKYCKNTMTSDISEASRCGVCCLGNECIEICDILVEDLQFYVNNHLGLNYDVSGLFSDRNGKILASDLCKALQGVFRGYNTKCDSNICASTRIITT